MLGFTVLCVVFCVEVLGFVCVADWEAVSYTHLKGIEELLTILIKKIHQKKKIRIIGDYDIDGVCSTYILLQGLKKANALVDVDIPDRMKDGYGISKELIERAYEKEIDTIITCDNGISAIEQIALSLIHIFQFPLLKEIHSCLISLCPPISCG